MTGADERDERSDLTAREVGWQEIATRGGRSGLRLVPQPHSEDGPAEPESRLLGEYNLYNG